MGTRILIIEDDEDNRESLALLFETRGGYDVPSLERLAALLAAIDHGLRLRERSGA